MTTYYWSSFLKSWYNLKPKPLKELAPPSTSGYRMAVAVKDMGYDTRIEVNDFNYSKDLTGPTGTGDFTVPYDEKVNDILDQDMNVVFYGVWDTVNSDGTIKYNTIKQFLSGYIKDVNYLGNLITVTFVDQGVKLEAPAITKGDYKNQTVSSIVHDIILKSGLQPMVAVQLNNKTSYMMHDDEGKSIGLSSSSSTVSATTQNTEGMNEWQTRNDYGKNPKMGNPPANAGTISGSAYPVNQCAGKIPWKKFPFKWVNYCPACGAVNKLKFNGSGIYCSVCDVDWDPVGGFGTSIYIGGREVGNAPAGTGKAACKTRLTAPGNTTINSSYTHPTTDGKSWWDVLLDVLEPYKESVNVFVGGGDFFKPGTVYILPSSYPTINNYLTIDDRVNLIQGSVNVSEPTPWINSVYVVYGSKTKPKGVLVEDEWLINKYPSTASHKKNPRSITLQVEAYGYTRENAIKHGKNILHKQNRDRGLIIDCTVIGHHAYYPGFYSRFHNERAGMDDNYYITRISHKLNASSSFKTELTMSMYAPELSDDIDTGRKVVLKSTGPDLSKIETIGREEAKFGSVQGVCSNAGCYVKLGRGDCWADSEWLYNKLEANGIQARVMAYKGGGNRYNARLHAWVQYNNGTSWVEFPYKKYGSKHVGDVSAGTPYVWVGPGRGNITGYLATLRYGR